MTFSFSYHKRQVLQALRYHFISKREIRLMIIVVNVFAIISAGLFYLQKILPFAFLAASFLWFFLMASFWFFLPLIVYRRASTFRDHFTMSFAEEQFTVGNERGSRSYNYKELSNFLETPYFFHLYFDARSFFLLPKEKMTSDEQFELRGLLKAKLSKST